MAHVRLPAVLLAIGLLFAPSKPALAHDIGPGEARELVVRGEILPLTEIVRRAEKIKPGKLLEAELKRKNNSYSYTVEILGVGGVVWEIRLDAKTGNLLQMEKEE